MLLVENQRRCSGTDDASVCHAGKKAPEALDKFTDQRLKVVWGGVYICNLLRLIKSKDHDLTLALSWVKSPFIQSIALTF